MCVCVCLRGTPSDALFPPWGMLVDKETLPGTWRPAKTSPRRTACTDQSRLTCREDAVVLNQREERTKGRMSKKRERGLFVLQRLFFLEWSKKRKMKRGRAQGDETVQDYRADSWGLCYLNIDWSGLSQSWDRISALAADPKKGFGCPPECEPQLVAILEAETTVVFQPWLLASV